MGLDCQVQTHKSAASGLACGGVGTVVSSQCHVLTETEVFPEVTVVSKDWETVSSADGGKELGCRMLRDLGSFGSVQCFKE